MPLILRHHRRIILARFNHNIGYCERALECVVYGYPTAVRPGVEVKNEVCGYPSGRFVANENCDSISM